MVNKISDNLPDVYDDIEEEQAEEDEGAGTYFAVGMGILIDEKIDYTIDGINYAIDAVGSGFAAVGAALSCGYGDVQEPAENNPIQRNNSQK